MADVVPSLTRNGFISNKNEQMKKLFEYFLASDYSQSNTFSNKIASLKYIMTTYKDSSEVKREIEKALRLLYQAHFDTVSPSITVYEDASNSVIRYNINISAVHDGTTYTIDRSIDSSLANIATYEAALAVLFEQYN